MENYTHINILNESLSSVNATYVDPMLNTYELKNGELVPKFFMIKGSDLPTFAGENLVVHYLVNDLNSIVETKEIIKSLIKPLAQFKTKSVTIQLQVPIHWNQKDTRVVYIEGLRKTRDFLVEQTMD